MPASTDITTINIPMHVYINYEYLLKIHALIIQRIAIHTHICKPIPNSHTGAKRHKTYIQGNSLRICIYLRVYCVYVIYIDRYIYIHKNA